MTREVVIGLDCGTSYLKLSIVDRNGIEYVRDRVPSPVFSKCDAHDDAYAASLWRAIRDRLEVGVMHADANNQVCLAMAIAGISPVLVLFDPSAPDHALTMPYWHIPSVDDATTGLARTVRRLRLLRDSAIEAGISQAVACDLIGYLNYRLTAQLTMNSITAGEFGLRQPSQLVEEFTHNNPRVGQVVLQSPSHACGVTRLGSTSEQIIVCAGSTDSFAAAISATAVRAGSRMIYLGTFGSLLEIVDDLPPLLMSGTLPPRIPYRWRLSVPGFGAAVEAYARIHFAADTIRQSLQRLDQAASSAPPGTSPIFFHLPIWDRVGRTRGSFGFEGWRRSEPIPSALGGRAVLEAIAYAIGSRTRNLRTNGQRVGLSGGGAQSETWRQVVSDALALPLASPRHSGGAWGAAAIAGATLSWDVNSLSSTICTVPNYSAHEATQKTAMYATNWYRGDHLRRGISKPW